MAYTRASAPVDKKTAAAPTKRSPAPSKEEEVLRRGGNLAYQESVSSAPALSEVSEAKKITAGVVVEPDPTAADSSLESEPLKTEGAQVGAEGPEAQASPVEDLGGQPPSEAPEAAPAPLPSMQQGAGVVSPVVEGPTGEEPAAAEQAEKESQSQDGAVAADDNADAARTPEKNPGMQAVLARIRSVAHLHGHNNPAVRKTQEAQAAAKGPTNEVTAGAKVAQIGKMGAAPAAPPPADDIRLLLRQKIEAAMPRTMEAAKEFVASGRVTEISTVVKGPLQEKEQASVGPLKNAVAETPSGAGIAAKPVHALPPTDAGPPPASVGAERAVPGRRPEAELPLEAKAGELDQQMQDADVSEEQLKRSNEPDFLSAVDAKNTAKTEAARTKNEFRTEESKVILSGQEAAATAADQHLGAMHAERMTQFGGIEKTQHKTKEVDEVKRAEVANQLENIYSETQSRVKAILEQTDASAKAAFDSGAAAARQAFEGYTQPLVARYIEDNCLGSDFLYWARNTLAGGVPAEVDQIFQDGRRRYIEQMDATIDAVADIIEAGLEDAQQEIQSGLEQAQTFVGSLEPALRDVGQAAVGQIQGKFDALRGNVDSYRDKMIEDISQKFVSAVQQIDAEIAEAKDYGLGIIGWAKEQIGGVIETIKQLKDMLTNVLTAGADVIDTIIKDPISFAQNLASGVQQGLLGFKSNILNHLKTGFLEWLFGEVAKAGIQIPQTFDAKGILGLILQVLGLTYANIRSRAVKILGEPMVAKLELAAEIFQVLITEGPAGLWKWLKDQLDGLKDTVIQGIKDYVVEKVIIGGITWLLSLLNPASAFVKAVKAIVDIVMFFVQRGAQIMELANAVIGAVSAVAAGNVGALAAAVEGALAKAIPVAVGFLASLLGLGDLSEKIRATVNKIQAPVNKAIDWVIHQAVKLVKTVGSLFGGQNKEGKADDEIGEEINFSAGEEQHRFWITPEGEAFVASLPEPLRKKIVRLRSEAEGISDPAKKTAALGALSALDPISNEIDTLGKKASKLKLEDPSRIDLDEQIEGKQHKAVGFLQKVFKALGHPERLELIPLEFEVPLEVDRELDPKYMASSKQEYTWQVETQEQGINDMFVDKWINNRDKFIERSKLPGISGRDPDGDEHQDRVRNQYRDYILQGIQSRHRPRPPPVPSLSPTVIELQWRAYNYVTYHQQEILNIKEASVRKKEAEAAAGVFMQTNDALHAPDQIAGGEASRVIGLGSSSINRSIGSLWKRLAGELHAQVLQQQKEYPDPNYRWDGTKMNVKIDVEFKEEWH